MLTSSAPRSASSDLAFFSSSKVSNSVASTSSNVVVTTRVARRPANQQSRSAPATRAPSSSSSPLSSPLTSDHSPPRKRKTQTVGSSSALPRDVKRLRADPEAEYTDKPRKRIYNSSKNSSRASSRQCTQPPSPEPIYRSSRSRSTSLFPGLDTETPITPRRWCTDKDGAPGKRHLSSEMVVKRLMKSYKSYFKNHDDPSDRSFQPHPTNYPFAELEYPNTGASERFILLAPKDKDHYGPIMDLERSLHCIVENYLTPPQQALFGPIPSDALSEAASPPPSPSPSPPHSRSSTSSGSSSLTSLSDSSTLSSLTSLSTSSTNSPIRVPLLRAVQRAIHRQDGPLFLRAIAQINSILRSLKYPPLPPDLFAPVPPNPLMQVVEGWSEKGMPKKVLMRIIEENYQRSVGPNVHSLKQYEAFSSTVYGELMPSLAHEIIQVTKLNEESLFLDLGSGVGNVVVQASLQTGCRSFGVELMPAPAKVARQMAEQLKVRCRMWGIRMGEVELEEGNMLTSKRVDELIAKADVVLVDNKVFEESLNEALRPKFLDLKEGAIVVSLKPFVSSLNARVTERNVDDISAIFDVTERPYHSGSVSWGNNGGSYYIHRVDRGGYAKIREKFENSRVGGRSTRGSRR
ncbi:S-adenosyl-L-methionine-dependent methyltransferase [Infundibulicybe gibba]|nr:S-adenosyl-L-methionine-dependent methyltransferase [Infundibulicybe gibba]